MSIKNNIFCNIATKFISDNHDIHVQVCLKGHLKQQVFLLLSITNFQNKVKNYYTTNNSNNFNFGLKITIKNTIIKIYPTLPCKNKLTLCRNDLSNMEVQFRQMPQLIPGTSCRTPEAFSGLVIINCWVRQKGLEKVINKFGCIVQLSLFFTPFNRVIE